MKQTKFLIFYLYFLNKPFDFFFFLNLFLVSFSYKKKIKTLVTLFILVSINEIVVE